LIPQLEALNLNEKELAERAREMATKYRRAAERAAAEAEVIRSRVKSRTEGGEEVAKLKAMVDELKAEVAELREKLSDR
jgi:hypothetical protein